ncbi:transposase [Paenibacillus zanthoxyli]|uniref:transposase n=1 Tax=Paenibacillus zanthoxyli TaxID=369399 RepID=UPI00046E63DE|nr:transposase [Paenibacillus zanthoxyli]
MKLDSNNHSVFSLNYHLILCNACKSASSRLIKKDFPEVKTKLWKENYWSQSFCLTTVGGAPFEVLKAYIDHQGKEAKTR